MLDRHTSDGINPVLLRHLRTMHRSGIIWLLAGFAVLAQVLYFYNRSLCFTNPLAAPMSLTASTGVLLVLAVLSMLIAGGAVADNVRKERGVDGMDPSLGTALTPWSILVGQALAMLASQAVVAIAYIPGVLYGLAACETTPKLLVAAVGALEAALFVLLATVQASRNGKGAFSPLWLMVAGVLVPLLIWSFAMAIMTMDAPKELKEECYLLGQLLAVASVIALSCAAIYGANRPRVLDITTPLHRTTMVLWLLWMPLLPLCFGSIMREANFAYLDVWGTLGGACSIFLCTLVSVEPLEHSRLLMAETRQRSGLRRWLWLLLQGGVVPGYLLALGVLLVTQIVVNSSNSTSPGLYTLMQCYGLLYCAIILWLRKTFRLTPGMAYVVLWCFNMVVSSFSGFRMAHMGGDDGNVVRELNPFCILSGEIFLHVGNDGKLTISPAIAIVVVGSIALWCYVSFKPFLRQLEEKSVQGGAPEVEK